MTPFTGRSAYHALQTAFTKRMSNNWQAGATYSLAGLWSAEGQPLMGVPGEPGRCRSRSPKTSAVRADGPMR